MTVVDAQINLARVQDSLANGDLLSASSSVVLAAAYAAVELAERCAEADVARAARNRRKAIALSNVERMEQAAQYVPAEVRESVLAKAAAMRAAIV